MDYRSTQVSYKLPLVFFCISLLIFVWFNMAKEFIAYNLTPSEPIGWYFVLPASKIQAGNLYMITSNNQIAIKFGFNPATEKLLKRVVATPGDWLLVTKAGILVNGKLQPNSKAYISFKNVDLHPLPVGYKHLLQQGEYFVMGETPNSFDSRYFGMVRRSNFYGRAILIFRR